MFFLKNLIEGNVILKNQLESKCDVNIFIVEGNVNLKEPIGGNAM